MAIKGVEVYGILPGHIKYQLLYGEVPYKPGDSSGGAPAIYGINYTISKSTES